MLSALRAYPDSATTSIHGPRLNKKKKKVPLNELLDGTTFRGALGVVKDYSNAFGRHQELVSG